MPYAFYRPHDNPPSPQMRRITISLLFCVMWVWAALPFKTQAQGATAAPTNTNQLAPRGYRPLCAYQEACALPAPQLVAFGSQGRFIYKLLHGRFECSAVSFQRLPADPESAYCSIAQQALTKHSDSTTLAIDKAPPPRARLVSRQTGLALALNASGQLQLKPIDHPDVLRLHIQPQSPGVVQLAIAQTEQDEALSGSDEAHRFVAPSSLTEGSRVHLSANAPAHPWLILEPVTQSASDKRVFFTLMHRESRLVLDVSANGAPRLWSYWGGENQEWYWQ